MAPSFSSHMPNSPTWTWSTQCLESKLCLCCEVAKLRADLGKRTAAKIVKLYISQWHTQLLLLKRLWLTSHQQGYRWPGNLGWNRETSCKWENIPPSDWNTHKGCDHPRQPICWMIIKNAEKNCWYKSSLPMMLRLIFYYYVVCKLILKVLY